MALVSVAAFAQTPPGHPMGTPPGHPMGTMPAHPMGTMPGQHAPATRAAVPRAPKPDPLNQADVSKIIGTTVYGSGGKDIGDISNVLMKPETKKIDRLVVHSGGVLGVGGRYVAVALTQFSWNAQKGVLTVSKTQKDINKMAEWKPSKSTSAPATTKGIGSGTPPSHTKAPASGPGH
ncbi:MAG: PRC-barrel domain-containing protein [Stellaceae bacterium]